MTGVCCCQWGRGWSKDRQKQEQEPYARLAELFLQVICDSLAQRSPFPVCFPLHVPGQSLRTSKGLAVLESDII